MLNLEKEQIASELRGSLLTFCKFFYKALTGRDFIVSAPAGRESHHITIAKALTRAARLEIPNHRLLINVSPGSGKPVSVDTLLLREDGSRVAIKEIQIGDKVLTHEGRFRSVLKIFKQGVLQTLKVRTFSEREVITAYDHPFLTAKGYKEAKDLKVGDVLGCAIPKCDFGSEISDEESRLLGYFVGDGSVSGLASSITASDSDEITDIFHCAESLGMICSFSSYALKNRKEHHCKTLGRINVKNGVREWLKNHELQGKTSYTKRVPRQIMLSNKRGICNFLAAYYTCDSYVSLKEAHRADYTISLTSVSKQMLQDCQHLLIRLGIRARLRKKVRNQKTKIQGDRYTSYNLDLSSQDDVYKFQTLIAPFMYHKKGRMLREHDVLRVRFDESILPDSIVSIENHEPTECMCIEVEGDHTFTANDIIVHNSTLLCMWVAWTMSQHPDSKYIYVSYSKTLSDRQTETIKRIMQLKEYEYLFDVRIRKDSKAKDYFQTEQGGAVASAGSAGSVTGISSGAPNLDVFSGALILDDLHKPSEVFSATIRQSVIDNFSQTLQQRLRGVNVPMIMIGQRLHEADVSAHVISGKDGYEWEQIILKSIDEAGNALYPEVDPLHKLLKRQETDPYVFASQYQQDPIPAGGALFKPEWFVLLDEEPEMIVTFVVCDTAETAKTYNDASAFGFFGLYEIEYEGKKTGQHAIHCINAVELRVEPKDLKDEFLQFWSSCMRYDKTPSFAAIEKKSTGVTLLSVLQEMRSIRVLDIPRSSSSGSKTKRFLDSQPLIAERRVSFPAHSKHTSWCIEHMSKITANDSHAHDDFCFVAGTKIATLFGDKNIEDIKVGDRVITPFGWAKVSAASSTGFHQVIRKFGLEGTGNHPVFSQSAFTRLDVLSDDSILSKLSLSELLTWKLKRLLFLKMLRTDLWGRGAIISLSTSQQKTKSVLKGCMSQFGSLITNLKFPQALSFIISTATVTITTLIIWLAYLVSNIISNTLKKDALEGSQKSTEKVLKKPVKRQKRGIARKKVGSGTEITQKTHSINCEQSHALSAQQNFSAEVKKEPTAQEFASTNTGHKEQERSEQDLRIKEVFSLTVESHGVYYANGILVSNCDALADALRIGLVEKTTLSMYSNQQTSSNAAKLLSAEFNKISSLRKSAYTH